MNSIPVLIRAWPMEYDLTTSIGNVNTTDATAPEDSLVAVYPLAPFPSNVCGCVLLFVTNNRIVNFVLSHRVFILYRQLEKVSSRFCRWGFNSAPGMLLFGITQFLDKAKKQLHKYNLLGNISSVSVSFYKIYYVTIIELKLKQYFQDVK